MTNRMKRFSRTVLAAALAACATLAPACVDVESIPAAPNQDGIKLATHVTDWRDEVIYQLIVDRFHNGDVNNDYNVDTRSLARYHGGDWQGIIDKLDYLQDLGVTTLWISPPVKNVEDDAGFASYHGYWTSDFLKHNPHFGDLRTLRRLSDELHKRGMKLILDIVTNHVGQVFFYDVNMNDTVEQWVTGRGDIDRGSGRAEPGEISRVTEYDPDFDAHGIDAYTSMGISGRAPIIFFDMPAINRTAPGPTNIDLNGDGKITTREEILGFSNPEWYHQRGRTYDYGTSSQPCSSLLPSEIAEQGCTDYDAIGGPKCGATHRITNYDRTQGDYLDGEPRAYCQNDQTLLGDFPGGLKDVATEREDVRNAMIQVFSYWIDVTDCDGFRIDTLKHVEYSFWEEFAAGIRAHAAKRGKTNFFMFGEAFDGNDILLKSYLDDPDSVDSVFLFSQKYAIDQSFKCAPGNTARYCRADTNTYSTLGTSPLYGWDYSISSGGRFELYSNVPRNDGAVDAEGNGVAPRDLLVNFLDNHDVGRYLFDRDDEKGVESLMNALSFLITQRGIPCIYYGTEQGFMGGNDPGNREDMSDPTASVFYKNPDLGYPNYQPWDTANPIYRHIRNLLRIRKAVPALRHGIVKDRNYVWHSTATTGPEAGIYAVVRTDVEEGKHVLIAINTHEAQTSSANGMSVPWGGGTLVDLLDDSYSVTVSSGTVSFQVPSMTTRILVPADDRDEYGL